MKRFLGKLQHLSTAEAEVWGQTDKSYSGAWRALPTPRVNLGKLQVPPNEGKIISVCCSRPSLHSPGRRQSRLLSLPRCWERSALPAKAAPVLVVCFKQLFLPENPRAGASVPGWGVWAAGQQCWEQHLVPASAAGLGWQPGPGNTHTPLRET